MAAWTQGVIGSGYGGEVQLGADKGRQESICLTHTLIKKIEKKLFFVQFLCNVYQIRLGTVVSKRQGINRRKSKNKNRLLAGAGVEKGV